MVQCGRRASTRRLVGEVEPAGAASVGPDVAIAAAAPRARYGGLFTNVPASPCRAECSSGAAHIEGPADATGSFPNAANATRSADACGQAQPYAEQVYVH